MKILKIGLINLNLEPFKILNFDVVNYSMFSEFLLNKFSSNFVVFLNIHIDRRDLAISANLRM